MKRLLTLNLMLLLMLAAKCQNPIADTSPYVCPPCGSTCDKAEYDKPGVCSTCNMVFIRKNQSKTIAFYLQDRVEVLDFAGPMEVFAYAGYKVFTVSKTKDPIKSQGILSVIPDYSIEDAPKADILAFFGGNSGAASGDADVINWVKSQEDVEYYFSVCTGAFILAEAGLLDGQTATTFHNALDNLESTYPKVDVRRNVRYVDNGKVITTAGVSAGIDGALHLVAKLQGLSSAKRTAYYMEYENWEAGEGLILTKDDPYMLKASLDELRSYEGTYEYKDGKSVDLKLNEEEKGIFATIGKTEYPIYFEDKDFFTDVESEPIFFKRSDKDQVIGYTFSENGELFKKIN